MCDRKKVFILTIDNNILCVDSSKVENYIIQGIFRKIKSCKIADQMIKNLKEITFLSTQFEHFQIATTLEENYKISQIITVSPLLINQIKIEKQNYLNTTPLAPILKENIGN